MAIEQLKLKARDELVRLTEQDLKTKYVNLPDKQKSIAATKFYIREIHNPLRFQVAEDDLMEGLVDGKNDLGCDFIHRDDGHVLIIQSKFRSPSAEEPSNEISHFQSILKRFRDSKMAPNSFLREVLSEIDWDSDTFELVFMTFSKLSPQARDVSNLLPNYPSDLPGLELRSEWKFLDENDLNIELRSARNLQRGVSSKKIVLYPVGEKGKRGASSVVVVNAGNYKSLIMALDAKQLIRCYEELERDSLFSLNIRNFIGNTSTNKEIIKSAESDSENFFLFNNGISCLASSVRSTDDHLEVEGLQVINGAQTVKALFSLIRESKRKNKELWSNNKVPNVLVRITEIPDNYGKDSKIREKITQYNNTQNTIKISDFRSNDSVQENLKEQFSQLSRFGKKVAYLPKRTDRLPPNSEVVKLEEFAKSVYAFLYEPTAFSGSSSFLFTLEKTGGYVYVFGDGSKIWERMPDDEFKLRAASYWIAQEFARHLKDVRDVEADPDARAALERKWLLVYAASSVFKTKYGEQSWRDRVRQFYKGDWRIDDDAKGKNMSRIFDAAKAGVITAYRNSKKYNQNFVHRNWMRSKDTPLEITDALNTTVLPLMHDIG